MNKGLLLDLAQFAVGGIAIYLYFQCGSILDTVMLVGGLSVFLIPLQYFSNKIHAEAGKEVLGDQLEESISLQSEKLH
jgi:hypothetical protein